MKKSVQKIHEAKYGEFLQLHKIKSFKPIKVAGLNPKEKKNITIANFFSEKKGRIN